MHLQVVPMRCLISLDEYIVTGVISRGNAVSSVKASRSHKNGINIVKLPKSGACCKETTTLPIKMSICLSVMVHMLY